MPNPPYVREGSWTLVPGHTVHVVIDDQNDFLHPEGWYGQNGIDISHMQRVIEPTKVLNDECRGRGVPIVWTRHGTKGVEDGGPFMEIRAILREGGLRHGTWGYEILEELGPRAEDWYVEKTRLSAFFQTNLELVLRSLGAETVLLSGVLTNQCVGATCKDALFRDQAGRRRGVRRYDALIPARACDRDDLGRLGPGEHARADAHGAAGVPRRRRAGLRAQDDHDRRPVPRAGLRGVHRLGQGGRGIGYSHAWFIDSQILWQDCVVYMTHALAATEQIVVGTAVTNPYTRHVTATASAFATLAELHPGRLELDRPGRLRGANDGTEPGEDVAPARGRAAPARSDGRTPRVDQRRRRPSALGPAGGRGCRS